jgi:hypothetical protein
MISPLRLGWVHKSVAMRGVAVLVVLVMRVVQHHTAVAEVVVEGSVVESTPSPMAAYYLLLSVGAEQEVIEAVSMVVLVNYQVWQIAIRLHYWFKVVEEGQLKRDILEELAVVVRVQLSIMAVMGEAEQLPLLAVVVGEELPTIPMATLEVGQVEGQAV